MKSNAMGFPRKRQLHPSHEMPPMNHLHNVEMSKYRRTISPFNENIRLQNDILIFYRRIMLDEFPHSMLQYATLKEAIDYVYRKKPGNT